MSNTEAEFWNSRYEINDFVYGTEPNSFFKDELQKLNPGRLYLPADGECRNGVHAAKQGWQVDAVDFSEEAKNKALKFAESENVKISYTISDLISYNPPSSFYDAAAIIFLHLNKDAIKIVADKTINSLVPGGSLIMQAYSKRQLGKTSGGPQNIDMLYSVDEIKKYFKNIDLIKIADEDIYLYESVYHNGDASVISMTGRKPG